MGFMITMNDGGSAAVELCDGVEASGAAAGEADSMDASSDAARPDRHATDANLLQIPDIFLDPVSLP